MPEYGMHCPFLNRADGRCSDYFSLDRLDHAFGFCFGEYRECRMYREMLLERQERRMTGRVEADRSEKNRLIQVTLRRRPAPAANLYHERAA